MAEDGTLRDFDLVGSLKRAMDAEEGLCEFEVWLSKDGCILKVRLIGERVPGKIANKRRKKVREGEEEG